MAETDADAIVEAARESILGEHIDPDVALDRIVRDSAGEVSILSLESLRPRPDRKRETVVFMEPESFSRYVIKHATDDETEIYADSEHFRLCAVLNDSSPSEPGWLDHQARLLLRPTAEWAHWLSRDGKLTSQTEFAHHIEDGVGEIADPPAADMLELATHFEVHQKVSFRSAKRLQDGTRQLTFSQDADARAGVDGTIDIPKEFQLRLAPFEGTGPESLIARLRYRLNDGNLAIGYQLVRPRDAQLAAFQSVLAGITERTSISPLVGTPPERPR